MPINKFLKNGELPKDKDAARRLKYSFYFAFFPQSKDINNFLHMWNYYFTPMISSSYNSEQTEVDGVRKYNFKWNLAKKTNYIFLKK